MSTITLLGCGADHVCYLADGETIVRVAKSVTADSGARLCREGQLLMTLRARLGVAIPEPVAVVAEQGILVYRRLPGTPLPEAAHVDTASLTRTVAELIADLHAVPRSVVAPFVAEDRYPLSAWKADAGRDYERIAARLDVSSRRRVEAFLSMATPAEPQRAMLCHNDLGAEHLLVSPATGAVTGVIDWSDAALTDPCRDFGRLRRDLGSRALRLILARCPLDFDDADLRRIDFYARCTLLEDLAFGARRPGILHGKMALSNFDATFDEQL